MKWSWSECGSRSLETAEFSTLFEIAAGPQGLETAVRNLQAAAAEAESGKERFCDSYLTDWVRNIATFLLCWQWEPTTT